MKREKGVTSAPCYACGKPVETVELPDGSRAGKPCKCLNAKVEEKAPEQPKETAGQSPAPQARENGVVPGGDA